MNTEICYYKLPITTKTFILFEVEYIYEPACSGSRDEEPTNEYLEIISVTHNKQEMDESLYDAMLPHLEAACYEDIKGTAIKTKAKRMLEEKEFNEIELLLR